MAKVLHRIGIITIILGVIKEIVTLFALKIPAMTGEGAELIGEGVSLTLLVVLPTLMAVLHTSVLGVLCLGIAKMIELLENLKKGEKP